MTFKSKVRGLEQTRIVAITAVLGMAATFLILVTNDKEVIFQDLSIGNVRLLLIVSMLLPIVFLVHILIKKTHEASELQEQFYQAQKMEAIGRLAGGIAHDFNNILASSSGYAEFLVEDLENIDPKLHDFAKQILRANHQAQKLVEQILTFSRKQQDTENKTVDLKTMLEDLMNLLRATMKTGVEFKTNIPNQALYMKANDNLLHQLILNLCVNAVDAMIPNKKGILSIDVSLSKLPDKLHFAKIIKEKKQKPFVNEYILQGKKSFMLNGLIDIEQDYIVLTVKDTGTGIPVKTLKKIFDPFFTTKDINKGTGLGLSAAQNILELHDAGMIVKTEEGVGTSFTILLPHLKNYKSLEEKNIKSDKIDNTISDEKNILLVEDDLSVAGTLEIMLERMGHQTLHCLNPLEALDALKDGDDYDIIISDYRMPHMNGLEFARKVYEDKPDLPVILITGFSDKKIGTRTKNTAISQIVRKPLKRKDLEEAIKTALAK